MNPLVVLFALVAVVTATPVSDADQVAPAIVPDQVDPVAVSPADDQAPSDSSVHYSYGRHYNYDHYAPAYGHHHHKPESYEHASHASYHHYEPYYDHASGHGYHHKQGYHHNVYDHHNHYNQHDYTYGPHHHGYVPVYSPYHQDHGHGYAQGHDAVGQFYHYTGPFGPFGFYANFYHDL